MTSELKPCPFCGSTAYAVSETDADDISWHFIRCRGCGVRTRGKWHSPGNDCPQLREEVREEWNTRIHSPGVGGSGGGKEEAEFELHGQDGICLAGASGLRPDAWAEIQHYAAQYADEGPLTIYEVTRTPVSASALPSSRATSSANGVTPCVEPQEEKSHD